MTANNDDKKFVRIAQKLGRALQWVTKAISTDSARPILTTLHVEPRDGEYGKGVIVGTDGFRLHMAQNINTGDVSEMPWQFEERLDLEEGSHEIRSRILASEHINEFWRDPLDASYPIIESIIPSRNKNLKPIALVAINPKYLIDAIKNAPANRPVYIRVYNSQAGLERGDLFSPTPVEVISQDKDLEDVSRMAVIMPMHMHQGGEPLVDTDWPTVWNGWPEEEKEEDDK